MTTLSHADSDASDIIAMIMEEMEGVIRLIQKPIDRTALRLRATRRPDIDAHEAAKGGVAAADGALVLPN